MANNNLPKNWVFIRGLIRSRFHWGDFPELFKTQLGVKNIELTELPGNGYLSTKDTPETLDEAIEILKSQVKRISGTYGLLGISLGGMLATRWAQLYPDDVSHLVLINSSSPLSPFYERLRPTVYAGILKNLTVYDANKIESFILKATSNNKVNFLAHLKEYTEFQQQHPVSLKNFLRQLKLTSQVNFTDIPKSQNLILSSKADRLVNSNCSQDIADTWNCPILYHPTAGHDLPLDDANWIISTIKDVLTET